MATSASTGAGDSRWGPRSGDPSSAFGGLSSARSGGRGGRGRGGVPRGGHGGRGGGGSGGSRSGSGIPATPPTRHAPLAATASGADAVNPNGHRKASPRPSASRRQSLRAGAGAVPSSPLVPSASLTSGSGSGSGAPNSKTDSTYKDALKTTTMEPSASANKDTAASNKNSSRRKRSGVGKPKNHTTSSSSSSVKPSLSSLSTLSTLSTLRQSSSPLSAKEKDDGVPSLLKRMNMDAPPPPSISAREREREKERQRKGSKPPAPTPAPIKVLKVNKDLPPHLAARAAPHTAPLAPSSSMASSLAPSSSGVAAAPQPTTPLRQDIAALVEHMRASAMTDSSSSTSAAGPNNDGAAGGHHHHIDWAGDDDDSLPDLDDWGVSRERLHLEPVEAVGVEEEEEEGVADEVASERWERENEEDAEQEEGEGEDDEAPELETGAQDHDGLISPLLTMSGLRALPDHDVRTGANPVTNNATAEVVDGALDANAEAEDESTPATPRAGSDSISSLSTAASISTALTTASSSSSANVSSSSASSLSTPQSQAQSWRMPLHPSLPAKPVVAPPHVVPMPMAATPMRGKEQAHSKLKDVGDVMEDDVHDEKEEKGASEKQGMEAGKVDDRVQAQEGTENESDVVSDAAVTAPSPPSSPARPEEIKATVSLPVPPALPLSTPALAPFLSPALAPVVIVESEGQSASLASASANPNANPPRLSGLAASIHAPKEIQNAHSAPAHISTWADAMDAQDLEASEVKQSEEDAEAPVQGVMASMHAFTPTSPPLMSSTSGGGGRGRSPREHHRERSSRAGGRHNAGHPNANANSSHTGADGGRWSSLSHNHGGSSSSSGAGVPPHMRGGGDGGGLSASQNNTHTRTHSTPPSGSSLIGGSGGPRSAPSWGGPKYGHGGHGGGGGSGGSGGGGHGGHGSWNSGGAYSGAYNMHDRYGRADSGHGHVKRPVITGAAITQLARTIGKGGVGGGGGSSTAGTTGGATAAVKGKSGGGE